MPKCKRYVRTYILYVCQILFSKYPFFIHHMRTIHKNYPDWVFNSTFCTLDALFLSQQFGTLKALVNLLLECISYDMLVTICWKRLFVCEFSRKREKQRKREKKMDYIKTISDMYIVDQKRFKQFSEKADYKRKIVRMYRDQHG